jgi:type VI secretion system secreted protein Hcp
MATDMLIKLGTFDGEHIETGFDKWTEVLAWSWGLSNSGSAQQAGGAGTGKANVQDLSFTKYVDATSHNLIKASASGAHIDSVKLVVRKAGGKAKVDYIKIELTKVLISSVSTGGSGGEDRLTENVSLNFGKIKFDYTLQSDKGGKGTDLPVTIDIASGMKIT